MKLLFKEDNRVAYTVEGDCAVPEGMALADAPENFDPAFLPYYKLTKTGVVLDTAGFPDVEVIGGSVVPSLPAKKATAWENIKAERNRRKAGGVKVGAKWFHSDDASRIQQLALVMMGAGLPAGLQWKTMDGSFITMTPALAQQVFTGQAASDQAIFAVAEGHRVAMEASADPAAYDHSTGWPKVFGEA